MKIRLLNGRSAPPRRHGRRATNHRAPIFLTLALLLAAVGPIRATSIGIDLGPSRVLSGTDPETDKINFGGLNGTPLVGSLSVDFLFTNNEFVRLFTQTQPQFDALITLQTNGSGLMGFLGGTGYLIDAKGNAISGFGVTGSASGDDGSLSIGLFPLEKDVDGTPDDQFSGPLDFYGVHFNFTLPGDPSFMITGGEFALADNGIFTPFAIGPGDIPQDIVDVPDTGSTALLLSLGLIGMEAVRRRLRSEKTVDPNQIPAN